MHKHLIHELKDFTDELLSYFELIVCLIQKIDMSLRNNFIYLQIFIIKTIWNRNITKIKQKNSGMHKN